MIGPCGYLNRGYPSIELPFNPLVADCRYGKPHHDLGTDPVTVDGSMEWSP